uniref:OBG-type G domain-containing protein n=1 Tax=Chromera velia CCMP2878 TaxID=1169474 RepID=A0A0G4I0Y3_9ALVE|eukprot:Cvel_10022.t1-p1 / transcript=Cvel_10022.t1 / gene=Cvel_10022 / organism=Chromera_velia_CCMP2878 / gene_product=Uncharacterized GTP-binding protein YGR210C, putative / transcript_product=Uncharacterized GTP-binding protein YGR210C, putative / location=Cvel_scaffold595:10881-13553(+) / protein_length=423 / sequence_SO=supercontig / SO=protein_coding / is_pseudo=false
MGQDFIIGCVGKPSAGKSTFFNASCEKGDAKVGNFPFTTIDPNQGVAAFTTKCPCKKFNVKCRPRYGTCTNGIRRVPVKMLDVAGLIPGASEGLGLGNKFLDDLRQADVLLHILDISGTTNEKGEATSGYDPSGDHRWLLLEIELWIFNNLWTKWGTISRRHTATNSTVADTLTAQLSGYGAKPALVQSVVDALGLKDPVPLGEWEKEQVQRLVKEFIRQRFPIILVLNKADSGGETDKNVVKMLEETEDPTRVVLCSALAECFLRKMRKQKFILYEDGGADFWKKKEAEEEKMEEASSLQEPDEKLDGRLDKIRDMVLFRYGSTGVQSAVNRAVDTLGLLAVYPVRNIAHFGGDRNGEGAFPECVLVRPGTTVRGLAKILHEDIEKHFLYAEGADGRRLGEDEVLTEATNVIRFVTDRKELE